MRISRDTLAALMAIGAGAARPLVLVCTVEGGIGCRRRDGGWDDPMIAPLGPLLVADIGYKRVEHAPARSMTVEWSSSAPGEIQLGNGPGGGDG